MTLDPRPRRTTRVLRDVLVKAAREAVDEAVDRWPLPLVDELTDRALGLLQLGDGGGLSAQRVRYLVRRYVSFYRDGAEFQQQQARENARYAARDQSAPKPH